MNKFPEEKDLPNYRTRTEYAREFLGKIHLGELEEFPWWAKYKYLLVVAHTHVQFEDFCWQNRIHKRPNFCRYVSDADKLRGLRSGIIILLDGWYYHQDFHRIRRMLEENTNLGRWQVQEVEEFPSPDIRQLVEIVR